MVAILWAAVTWAGIFLGAVCGLVVMGYLIGALVAVVHAGYVRTMKNLLGKYWHAEVRGR